MDVQVIHLAPIRVAMLRHLGPYDELGPVFDKLFTWVNAHQVPIKRTIGVYWDNPDYVVATRLRSAACVEIESGVSIPSGGSLLIGDERIKGGDYAMVRHVGPYEELAAVWKRMTEHIEGPMRRTISDEPAFEVYVNDASDTPASQLITELYMPLK